MTIGTDRFSESEELWVAYRATFQTFAQSVHTLQSAPACCGRIAALLEVEKARLAYNDARDRLAERLTRSAA